MVRRDAVIDGRFELEEVTGRGGMGVVYRARDLTEGGYVALKLLRTGPDNRRDGGVGSRFVREVSVLSRLEHRGIVRYVAHGTTADGDPYLAMEWVNGEALSSLLRRQSLTVAESVRLARHTAEALAAVHAQSAAPDCSHPRSRRAGAALPRPARG